MFQLGLPRVNSRLSVSSEESDNDPPTTCSHQNPTSIVNNFRKILLHCKIYVPGLFLL